MPMNPNENRPERIPGFDEVAAFHGHACPGLSLGYRVAVAAMNRLRALRAPDEDLVAVVETDACSADAVQFVCGCTFGKGNLVFLDHGKHVYTFFNRAAGKGIRIYAEAPGRTGDGTARLARRPNLSPEEQVRLEDGRGRRIEWLLSLPENDLLQITEVREPPPARARIQASSRCSACGELMMETRARAATGGVLCIPCAASAGSVQR